MRIELDRASHLPLHRQLRRAFMRLIAERELDDLAYLPSTRDLADSLGINRLTVLKVYQTMRRAGVLGVQPGRGYYPLHGGVPRPRPDEPDDLLGAPALNRVQFEAAYSETVRSAREMPLSFAAGYPDRRLLPTRAVRRLFTHLSEADHADDFGYQAPWGHPALREQVWTYLAARGIDRRPDFDVLITNGAQHALDIFARGFRRRTGCAAVESPSYYGALAALRVNGYTLLPLLQDLQGLSAEALGALCQTRGFDFLYTNPTFNNPTGMTLTRPRREAVVALAARHGFIILEDDTYADLGFNGSRLPSLITLDREGRVCHVGSFSKSFMAGLRMGFIVGPRTLLEPMADLHGVNDMCSSTLSQLVLSEALKSGLYDRHVRRMRRIYHRRSRVMNEMLLRALPPGCRFAPPRGGFFCWVRLPEPIDEPALKRRCNAAGVDYASGPQFSCDGHGGNFIRLNFTLLDEKAIRAGIEILAREIKALLRA